MLTAPAVRGNSNDRTKNSGSSSMTSLHKRRLLAMVAVALATLTISACATPGPVITEDVGAIRTGVTAARQEASDSFASANQLAREQGIARKVRLPETILRPEDFPVPVSADAAGKWNNAF